ncbi:MAG: DnaJ domain-containing protein [Thermodesulfovibrionales bacterium]
MGKLHNSTYRIQDREYKLLLASGLLCSYERSTPEEVCQKALKCFEILLDILEDAETVQNVSALVSRPATSVQNSARAIIDLLLFNKEADPYVSLGLPRNADKTEANRRWKHLMVLYHPDKYFNSNEYEEKAKKINEAYEKLQKGEGKDSYFTVGHSAKHNKLHVADRTGNVRVRRRVPAFILALAIFAVIIFLWLFISI